MDKNGFFRVAAVSPQVFVADPMANARAISDSLTRLEIKGVELAVLPELCLTGYTCADLFHNSELIDGALQAFGTLLHDTASMSLTYVIGMPLVVDGAMYNCAVFVSGGRPVAVFPKSYIPTYNEFYEARWWRSGLDRPLENISLSGYTVPFGVRQLVKVGSVLVSAEICEDLWVPQPPSCAAALAGADVVVNLSASDALTGKYSYIRSLVAQQSARCLCTYVYASAGFGESSTDLVFDAIDLICSNGRTLAVNKRFDPADAVAVSDVDILAQRRDRLHINTFADGVKAADSYPVTQVSGKKDLPEKDTLLYYIDPLPFVPAATETLDERCQEIVNIQSAGLARRLDFTHCKKLVVGISGGLDSTLALLVAVRAFDRLGLDRKGVIGVTMPGFGTTGRTHDNAVKLMELLGVTTREISIVPAVEQHFRDIGHDPAVHDVTYENSQARQRTYLLMDIANHEGGMVLGTGDLSELALGWATYNGDHMSMYGVNAGVPKTLVRHLVTWFASRDASVRDVLLDVAATPISPELIPANPDGTIEQKTEDLVGPYELHDFFLYYTLRYGFTPRRIYYMACLAFGASRKRAEYYSPDVIRHWLKVFYRRFFAQQFKRSCLPDGPKVGSVCLSPRGDWRMPSDASARIWLDQIESI